jgi:hypothetical protein
MPAQLKNRKYRITPLTWLIKDEASVKFHVQSDDYFGTLATILSLIKQQIKKDSKPKAAVLKSLHNLEKDLLLLQKEYQIKPRPLASALVKPKKIIRVLKSKIRK